MASEQNLIGQGACPVCGSAKARFTFSKKSLACMTCNACNCQIFARSDFSDAKLRSCVRAAPAVPALAPPAAEIAMPQATPQAQPKPAPAPAVVAPKRSFGLMGAW